MGEQTIDAKKRDRPRRRAIVSATLLGTALAGTVLLGRQPFFRWLTDRAVQRIEAAPDEPDLVSNLAAMGDRGLEALVGLLNAKNVKTANAAKRVLMEEIVRWRTLDRHAYTPKVTILAKALGERVGQFCPDAKRDAAEVATLILLDFQAAVHGSVAADCETVLRASLHLRQMMGSIHADDSPADALNSELPGTGPTENLPVRRGESADESTALKPVLGDGIPLTSPPVSNEHGDLARGDSPAVDSNVATAESASRNPVQPFQAVRIPASTDTNIHPSDETAPAPFSAVDTVDLMRQLQTGTAENAETELVKRGFGPVQLELARRLFDPAPEARKQLLRLLPGLRTVDPLPWLLQLCRDQDNEVRLMAVSLAASSGDPALVAEVERLARQDSETRLQSQTKRIAERREQSFR